MSEVQEEKIRGVFSSQEIRKVGTGTTTRKTVQKVFWFAEQDDEGRINIQAININFIPSGPKKIITRDELISNYSPEPEYYFSTVFPKIKEVNAMVEKGDKNREKGETFTAEFEYANALAIDSENVKANFGIGLTYLQRGESDKADNIFNRLLNLDAAFSSEHKHLFNEFGINLRKNKMLEQALEYYNRAFELSSEDENLHLNTARVYLEKKGYQKCVEHVLSALKLSPNNDTAIKFLDWLMKKSLVPKELAPAANEILKLSAGQD